MPTMLSSVMLNIRVIPPSMLSLKFVDKIWLNFPTLPIEEK